MSNTKQACFERIWLHVMACAIDIPWKARSLMEGLNESESKGRAGTIYCDLQPYYPGASITRLNWKLLARDPRHPMLTEYETENRVTVCVLTDVGSDMDFGAGEFTKQELAALLSGSLLSSAGLTQELGRFVAFTHERVELVLPAGSVDFAASLAMSAVESTIELAGSSARSSDGLSQALQQLPSERSLVFVVSDFHWLLKKDAPSEENREMLAYAAANHEVVCLVVQDPDERNIPVLKVLGIKLPGFLQVGGTSSGDTSTVYTGKGNRKLHLANYASRQAKLRDYFTSNGCAFATFSTDESEDSRSERLVKVLTGDRKQLCLDDDAQSEEQAVQQQPERGQP